MSGNKRGVIDCPIRKEPGQVVWAPILNEAKFVRIFLQAGQREDGFVWGNVVQTYYLYSNIKFAVTLSKKYWVVMVCANL